MNAPLNHTMENDSEAITALLDAYTKALFEKDVKTMEAMICPRCIVYASRRTPEGEWRRFNRTREEFLLALSMQEDPPEFIMKDIQIQTRGHIASVWVDYEFRRNGQKVHEGIESFHLVRPDGKWRIVSLVYTAEV